MKPFSHYKNSRFTATFKYISTCLALITSLFLLSSCHTDDLEIQKGLPFEVVVMPLTDQITKGQTMEMRFAIQRTDHYMGTHYFIRYFQYEGQGLLRYYQQDAYLPNDSYSLPAEQFRLYYTSQSTIRQSFTIWISDNFGNEKQLSFTLNSSE